jgi:prevent-host-death family protein
MDRIGVRELRQNASRYLERVSAGETIEVTDRGRPIARLVPSEAGSARDRLAAAGRLRRRAGSVAELGPPLPPRKGKPLPSELLARMRETER